jgi:hypothetical protein
MSDKKTLLIVTAREWRIHKILLGLTVLNFLLFLFVALFVIGEYKSIFDYMSVEFPLVTCWCFAFHDILTHSWSITIPFLLAAVLSWAGLLELTYEKLQNGQGNARFLQSSYSKLFWVLIFINCIVFLASIGIVMALFMPMIKLVTIVG